MRKLLALASLGAVVALATVAAAQGAIVSKTTIDLTGFTVTNACNGELVTMTSGTATFKLHETDAGSGRVNVGEEINVKTGGVGAVTGALYNWNENENVTENNITLDDSGAVAANESANSTVIGQGKVPNFNVHLNAHLTMTRDGTITVDRFDLTTNC